MVHSDAKNEAVMEAVDHYYDGKPTDEELSTLRRVAGGIPLTAYVLCFVEFCERGSYYSATGVISNFVNRVCLTTESPSVLFWLTIRRNFQWAGMVMELLLAGPSKLLAPWVWVP
jgi:hypothetical protein